MYYYSFSVSDSTLTLSGAASVSVYQQALSAITYINFADEPTNDDVRIITFQVFDGMHFSPEVSGRVSISLVSDQPIMLMCGTSMANFEEGSATPIQLTHDLVLIDLDIDDVILSATVTISNAQMGDSIGVDHIAAGSLSVVSTGVSITITGNGSASQYQVRLTFICIDCTHIIV